MGEQLPFPDAYFGVALIPNVIDHVADPARVLAELRRCVEPGGLVWLSCHVSHAAIVRLFRLLRHLRWSYFAGHPWYFSPASLRAHATAAGLEVIREQPWAASDAPSGGASSDLRQRLKRRLLESRYLLLRRPG